MKKNNYIFTNRVNSKKGIMAIVLGSISCIAVCLTIYLTYKSGEAAPTNFGASILLSLVFSVLGILLAVGSRFEKDLFYFFSYIGIIINFIAIVAIIVLLYLGARGI